jgi:hypothetical protein
MAYNCKTCLPRPVNIALILPDVGSIREAPVLIDQTLFLSYTLSLRDYNKAESTVGKELTQNVCRP